MSFLIKLIAALMLSTKTAFFAITFSILSIFVYALIEYVFYKKKVLKIRCLFFVLEFCFILFLFSYSPVKYKMQGYITNINNNTDNDVSSVNSECDYLINELSDKYNLSLDVILKEENIDNIEKEYLSLCIEKCPQKFSVPKSYVEFYSVKENFDFWFDTIKQDTSFLTNYRGFKMSMYDDILNKHSDKIDKWLGIGYSSNFPYLERDFIGQEVWLGKIGMFLVTIPFVAIFAFSLVSLLIHFKKKINIFTCSFLLASAYMILSSILAGHVFGIFLTTCILSLLLVGLYNEVKRNQININDNKISFLLLHLGYGGIESATINTANSLCDDYDIEIMSFYKLSKTQANRLNDKIKVKYLYDGGPNKEEFLDAFHNHKIFNILKEGIRSVSILTKKKIRVINYIKNCDSKYIVSTRYDFSALLSKYGNDNSVKIAQEHHYHNNNKRYINILKNKYYNIDFLFALTKTLEKDYKKFLIKNKHTKVVLVPNMLYYIPSKQSKLDKRIL
ncbi:MAG: O-antigen ligase family protein [Bacilli bacterium]